MPSPLALLAATCALACAARAQVAQFVAAPLPILNGSLPHHCVLADFDRDRDDDALVSGSLAAPYSVFANDGLGVLTANVLPPLSMPGSTTAAFVDFDGDNDDDVFLSWIGSGQQVALLRYMGGSTWQNASASLPPMQGFLGIVVADLDGDGDQDLAGCGNALSVSASGILTNTNGVFTFAPAFGTFGVTIAGGDIDGDGDLDIATSMPLQLWRNDGGMVFTDVSAQQLPPQPLPTYIGRLAFGDVDGDGDQDLVVGHAASGAGGADSLLRNNGGTFAEVTGAIPPHPGANTMSVALADVDDDGDLDLLRGGNPHPNLCLNDGSGAFTLAPNRLPPLANAIAALRPGDLDRDGDADLLMLGFGQSSQVLWNRHRHVSVQAPPTIGQNWTVELWGQPGYGAGTRGAVLGIGLARLAQPVDLPALGVLWLDVGAPFVALPTTITPAAGGASLGFAIPNTPSLAGITLHVQALIEESAGLGDARFTQLVSATIQ